MENLGNSSLSGSFTSGHWDTTNGWATQTTDYTGNHNTVSSGWSLSRSNIPGFHRKKRNGELLGYGWYDRYEYHYESPSATILLTKNSNPNYQCKHVVGAYHAFLDNVMGAAILRSVAASADARPAVQQAVASLSSKQFDLGVFAGELRQNMLMFSQLARRTATVISVTRAAQEEMRKQRRRRASLPRSERAKLNARAHSGRYLAVRFGWIPLYRDIQSFVESAAIDSKSSRYFGKGSGPGFGTSRTWSTSGSFHHGTSVSSAEANISLQVQGLAAADIRLPRFRVNPLEIAWERIPYSFVVDWFLTVGRSLVAASNVLASRRLVSCGSIFVEANGTAQNTWTAGSGWSGTANQYSTGSSELKLRAPMAPPLYPVPRVRVGFAQVVDSLALLVQAISKRR